MFGDEEDQNPEEKRPSSVVAGQSDASAGAFSGPAELSDPSELPGPLAGMLAMMQSAARLSFKSCDEQDACDTALALE
ncbi:MAG TPA: hypothetical protein VL068_01205, partial [Microthrixaceae bacterium]|nr:hypothetical protein [Microthrixaceae bacterium]